MKKLFQIKQFLKGSKLSVNTLTKSYDGVSKQTVEEEIEKLEENGVVEHFVGDIYVLSSFEDSQKERKAVQKIAGVSARLHSQADTKTTVTISGTLVKDKEYTVENTL